MGSKVANQVNPICETELLLKPINTNNDYCPFSKMIRRIASADH